MHYNYDFEIAAFIFMSIILVHFILNKQFPIAKTRMFRLFLLCSILECTFNISSSMAIARTADIPLWVNQVLAYAFFVCQSIGYYFFFCYTLIICELKEQVHKNIRHIGTALFIIDMFLTLTTPITHFFYYFDEEKNYCQGMGADVGYYYIFLYLFLEIFLMVYSRKNIKKNNKLIVYVYTFCGFFAISVQFIDRNLLMTSFLRALTIAFMYLSLQNPNELIDVVTGTGNESAFATQLKNAMELDKKFGIIVVDVKQQRDFDSIYGFDKEKKLLENVGTFLLEMGGSYEVFRPSGDTFTLIVRNVDKVREMAGAIEERFQRAWSMEQYQILLQANIMVMNYPKHFDSYASMKGFMEYLLGKVKSENIQKTLYVDSKINDEYIRLSQVEMALNQALKEHSLNVYFQPIYSVKEDKITCLEALVRLYDAKLGYIPPDEFISIAEKKGSILELGRQVFEKCCSFIANDVMKDDSFSIHSVHVNLSVMQCMQTDLAQEFIPLIEKYKIPGEMINLEITEKAAITMPKLMLQHMRQLRALGVSFSLDDYGTGNSNCSYLINLPFQKVKFDKNLIWSYFENDTAKIVLDNEFQTIQKLGLPVVAEGVESKNQFEVLKKLGIDYIQGYYFGRPMPGSECIKFVRNCNKKE